MYTRGTDTDIRATFDVHRTASTNMRQNLINPVPTATAAQEPTSVDITRESG